jgi:hypothetical protein
MTMATPKTSAPPRGKSKHKVRYFRLRNRLKDKAGIGVTGGGGFAVEALEAAMKEIDKFSDDYPDFVAGYIKKLLTLHRACKEKEESHRQRDFRSINEIAHDMCGQGGTFGYPIITTVAKSLHEFTGKGAGRADDHLEVIKAHIDTMHVVIRERVEGDGGQVGSELLGALDAAIKKFSKRA